MSEDVVSYVVSEDLNTHYGSAAYFMFQRKVVHGAPHYGQTVRNVATVYGDGRVVLNLPDEPTNPVTREDLTKLVEWLSERYVQPLRRI